jgi:hypothetical protein
VIDGMQYIFEKLVERCGKCIACQVRYLEKETLTTPAQSSDSEYQGETTNFANGPHILNTWKNYFCQLLDGINDAMQIEMHTDGPLVTETSSFETAIAI